MGVDARMQVHLTTELTGSELNRIGYIFGSAFHNHLMLGMNQEIWNKPLDYDKEEWSGRKPNKLILNVPLSGRYYGPGYERGSIMDYIVMAEFLEILIPNCKIYYGGDSSDEFELFDRTARLEMMQYFIANNGKDNYVRAFSHDEKGEIPKCPSCKVDMVQSGFGANYRYFSCMGCGWIHREKDGIISTGYSVESY